MEISENSLAIACLIALALLFPVSRSQDSPQDYINAHNAARAEAMRKEFTTRCRSPLSDMNRGVHDVFVVAATIVKTTKGKEEEVVIAWVVLRQGAAMAVQSSVATILPPATTLASVLTSCDSGVWRHDPVLEAGLMGDIPLSLQALRSGDYKFSERGTMDAAVEARPCEKEFTTRCRSPLSDMNRVVHDVSVVAATIVKTTKGS
ncbi:hypothetical protein POTOM_005797 [Populus tomentosa]|uniref:Pectinesterase inhibitor domain-containing protein n=1 Tax=Populus tomentosa TaxID=118781 RepID=A0A8X8ASH3_POPTO|nr:hypothetical protein POTOM_005797 [Populus tomentosa]